MISFWKKLTQKSPGQSSNRKDRFCCHWVLPRKLAIGPLPIHKNHYARLQEEQIETILSLCPEAEGAIQPEFKSQFQCLCYPLLDSHYQEPLKPEDLAEAVKLVHQTLEEGKSLYIHCFAGIERSPTVCLAYLCRHQGLELWESLRFLKEVHRRSAPTETELQAIQAYLKSPLSPELK